jgi:hypothetical protein
MPARKRRAGRATEKAACAALRLRARSPAGVPPRFSPAGLSSRGLSVGPGFPRRDVKLRACRNAPSRSQRSTSRAGRSAGRHDARAARERIVSFRPRAPHSLRLRGVPSQKASFEERDRLRLLPSRRRSQTVCIFRNEVGRFVRRGFSRTSQHSDDSLAHSVIPGPHASAATAISTASRPPAAPHRYLPARGSCADTAPGASWLRA